MDLIDRYLDTVRLMLPGAQRDDITAELRDVLMSRREEREAELGRPLTRGENEDLLRGFGHPIVVAARYGRQSYLIGPELYAVYLLVLKVVVAAIAFAALVTGVVQSAVSPDHVGHALASAASVVWTGGFAGVGAVTMVFAALQHSGAGARMLSDWRVDELPRFGRRGRRAPAWVEHAAGLVVQGLFLLWWTGVLPFSWGAIPVEPHGLLRVGLAPVWSTLYWPVIWLTLAAIVVETAWLVAPRRLRLCHALDMLRHAGLAALAAVALAAGCWAVVTGTDVPLDALAKVGKGVNLGIEGALIVVIVASIGAIVRSAWQIYRAPPGAAAPT
jgi:hypothetical protein